RVDKHFVCHVNSAPRRRANAQKPAARISPTTGLSCEMVVPPDKKDPVGWDCAGNRKEDGAKGVPDLSRF
ncbi:hypothetical protein Tco_0584826, partial [Tanacetum coccineum]